MGIRIATDFAIPLSAAICLTAALYLTNADIAIESWFYSPLSGWFLGKENPWYLLYEYGNVPALLLSVVGLLAFVWSYFQRKLFAYRRVGLFLVTFMILGPGLIVNTLFKDHWGRPRPIDIVNFGGTEPFHHAWEKGTSGQGKSFPSGHAAVGFYLFAPFFIFRRASRRWAIFFLCLGLSYGVLMGVGRMIQGGHFPSDVIWSGAMTYVAGLILYYIFRLDRINHPFV
jgi:membrane-associated PAP2 superfamily phosphatase